MDAIAKRPLSLSLVFGHMVMEAPSRPHVSVHAGRCAVAVRVPYPHNRGWVHSDSITMTIDMERGLRKASYTYSCVDNARAAGLL